MKKKYFVYDPMDNGFATFATVQERDKAEEEFIQYYLDEVWSEDVEHIISGVITREVKEYGRIKMPAPDEIDEAGCDVDGNYWPNGIDYICNYKMVDIEDESGNGGVEL